MAQISRELLNADGMSLTVFTGGQSNIGFGISGTWTGTVSFFGSTDGIYFIPIGVTPFASGTAVQTATANGNWFTANKNYLAVKVVFARTTGSVQVNVAGAVDSSWQDAFLTQTTIFNSKESAATSNTLTQTAQTNRAWNLTFCEICLNGPQGLGQVAVTIYDGTAAGSVIFKEYIPNAIGSVGYTYKCNLPTDANGLSTLVGTPGNAMTIAVTGVSGTGSSIINTKFQAA